MQGILKTMTKTNTRCHCGLVPRSTRPMTLTSHLCVSDASHLHLMHPYFIQPVLYLHNRSAAVSNHTVWPELQKQQYVQGACAVVVVIQDLYPLPFFLPSLPPHCSQNTAVAGGIGPGNDCRSQLCWSRTASIMLNPACGRSFLRGNKIIQEALHTVSHPE